MNNFYSVIFADITGTDQLSRIFETIRAARSWARKLKAQKYCSNVRIYRGGAGGEIVK